MRHTIHKRGSRDKNEKLFTEYLRRANVKHELLPEGFGADILLFIAPMHLIEIKNPDVPKSDRALTEKEKEVQEFCAEAGIPYFVVEQVEELAKIINDWIDKQEMKHE